MIYKQLPAVNCNWMVINRTVVFLHMSNDRYQHGCQWRHFIVWPWGDLKHSCRTRFFGLKKSRMEIRMTSTLIFVYSSSPFFFELDGNAPLHKSLYKSFVRCVKIDATPKTCYSNVYFLPPHAHRTRTLWKQRQKVSLHPPFFEAQRTRQGMKTTLNFTLPSPPLSLSYKTFFVY